MASRTVIRSIYTNAQRLELGRAIALEAFRIEREIKLKITSSTPAGRTYKIGRITSGSKGLAKLGLKSYKTKSGKTRYVTGSKIYRASAKGQAPGVRTGGLLNANSIQKLGVLLYRVKNTKKYAAPLDAPNGLNRPFFASTVAGARPGFTRRLQEVVNKF